MNTGYLVIESDCEVREGVFNTSKSNLWSKLQRVFADEIKETYSKMRQKNFTYDKIMEYMYTKQIATIGERQYNLNAYSKYIRFGRTYLHMLHGNRIEHMKRFLKERLIYLDSLYGFESTEIKDSITIRANHLGNVYLDIKTYSPQYVKVKWRNNEYMTKRVGRGETVRFEGYLPTNTDQEILIYNAKQLKDIGDLSILEPKALLVSNAVKLTSLVCTSKNLLNVDVSKNTYLQNIDFTNCSILGTATGGGNILDITNCSGLRKLNVYGTQLTSVKTNIEGGNLEEIYYPYSIQNIDLRNQSNLRILGIPYYIGFNNAFNNSLNQYASSLTDVYLENCPKIETFGINYKTNNTTFADRNLLPLSYVQRLSIYNSLSSSFTYLDFSHNKYLINVVLDNILSLTELKFNDMQHFYEETPIEMLNNVTISNCPNIEHIEFNSTMNYGGIISSACFAPNTTLDFSKLNKLRSIKSNCGIHGLTQILLPPNVKEIVFSGTSDRYSDLLNMWCPSLVDHSTDNFTGIDLKGLHLNDFCMESLVNVKNVINMDIIAHTETPAVNNLRDNKKYPFITPSGSLDLTNFSGTSVRGLFKGIDTTKLNIICNNDLPSVTDAESCFENAFISDESIINNFYSKIYNITNAQTMFKECNGLVNSPELHNTITTCQNMYRDCISLVNGPSVIPDNVEDCSYMFYGCSSLINGVTLGNKVTDCQSMYYGCSSLTNATANITNSVVSCLRMFYNCTSLVNGPSVIGLNVENCQNMFYGCSSLLKGPEIIPDKVTTCQAMFYKCESMVEGPKVIGSKVTSCYNMFAYCNKLIKAPEIIPGEVTTCYSMFYYCESLEIAPKIIGSKVTNCQSMFEYSKITESPELPQSVTNVVAMYRSCNKLLAAPNIPRDVENCQNMFYYCESMIDGPMEIPDKVKNCESMFEGCISLVNVPRGLPDSVTNCSRMYYKCESLINGPTYIGPKVTTCYYMFAYCKKLINSVQSIPNNVLECQGMYDSCSSLQTAPEIIGTGINNCYYMFNNCSSLVTAPRVIGNNVTNGERMFYGCSSLTTAPEEFSQSLINAYYMFYGCTSLESIGELPLSIVTATNMFYGCTSLRILENFPRNATSSDGFIYNCSSLRTINSLNLTVLSSQPKNFWAGCVSLENINFDGTINFNFDASISDKITVESLEDLLNNLSDRTGKSPLTLTIGSANIAKLNESQLNVAISKNWVIGG